MRGSRSTVHIFAASLLLLLTAAACGPRNTSDGASSPQGTVSANEIGLTIEAQLTQYAPTYEIEVMTLAAVASANAADYASTQPVRTPQDAVTADSAGAGSTSQPAATQAPSSGTSATSVPTATLASAGGLPSYQGGDENTTTLLESIAIGETRSANISNVFDAHNWVFNASAGQSVTIAVTGQGAADPALRLIDPDGVSLTYVQDSGSGVNANLTFTLPASGLYTVRVDLWVPGDYTISVTLN